MTHRHATNDLGENQDWIRITKEETADIMKSTIEKRDKILELKTNRERRVLIYEWIKTGKLSLSEFHELSYLIE